MFSAQGASFRPKPSEPARRDIERSEEMPLSFGIPLGILVILVGAVLLFATNTKRLAKITIGIGVVITLLTLTLIILAVNSPM